MKDMDTRILTTGEMQAEIIRLKKENDVCILAHAYQSHDIWEIADYVGDSFGLSLKAEAAAQDTVVMCGVRFMAETVKILAPNKRVVLPNPESTCPMAEQYGKEEARKLKEMYPDHKIVAYINTTAELKTETDVVVTSSSALKILKNMKEEDIIFLPDPNLGGWISKKLPEKNIKVFEGGCPVHMGISAENVVATKESHPEALLLVHPECREEVISGADFVGSTTEIIDFAKESDNEEFIIGTETSIVDHLKFACPEKKFFPLFKGTICSDMKNTCLADIYGALLGTCGEEIVLEPQVIEAARRPIERMIELG